MPTREQLLGVFFIDREPFTLHIWTKAAVFIGTFIVGDASQSKSAVNCRDCLGDVAGLVGIFNA